MSERNDSGKRKIFGKNITADELGIKLNTACANFNSDLTVFENQRRLLIETVDPKKPSVKAKGYIDIKNLKSLVDQIEQSMNKLIEDYEQCTSIDTSEEKETHLKKIREEASLFKDHKETDECGIIVIFKKLLNNSLVHIDATENNKPVLRKIRLIILKFYTLLDQFEDIFDHTSSTLLLSEITRKSTTASKINPESNQFFRRIKKYKWSHWYPISGHNVYFVLRRTAYDLEDNALIRSMSNNSKGGGKYDLKPELGAKLNEDENVISLSSVLELAADEHNGGAYTKTAKAKEDVYSGYPIQLEQIMDSVDKFMSYIPRLDEESQQIHLYIKHNLPRPKGKNTFSPLDLIPGSSVIRMGRSYDKGSKQIPTKMWLCVCIRYLDEGERVINSGEDFVQIDDIRKHPDNFLKTYDWYAANKQDDTSSSKNNLQQTAASIKNNEVQAKLLENIVNCGNTKQSITYKKGKKTTEIPVFGSEATHFCFHDKANSTYSRFGKYKLFIPLVIDSSRLKRKAFEKEKDFKPESKGGGRKKYYHWSNSPALTDSLLGKDDYDVDTGDVSGIIMSYDPCGQEAYDSDVKSKVSVGVGYRLGPGGECRDSLSSQTFGHGENYYPMEYKPKWRFPTSLAVFFKYEKGLDRSIPHFPNNKIQKWIKISHLNNLFGKKRAGKHYFKDLKTTQRKNDNLLRRCSDWKHSKYIQNKNNSELPEGIDEDKHCSQNSDTSGTDCERIMYKNRFKKCYGLRCQNRVSRFSNDTYKRSYSYAQCQKKLKKLEGDTIASQMKFSAGGSRRKKSFKKKKGKKSLNRIKKKTQRKRKHTKKSKW